MGASWAGPKPKNCFQLSASLTLGNSNKLSQSDYEVWWKTDFIHQPMSTSSIARLRGSPKALLKAKLTPEKDHSHYLVVCYPPDPLQLSESQQNYLIWEVCSANQWDALKTATPTAGTGHQKGLNSSHTLYNQSFKSWRNWGVKFCLICPIHPTSHWLTTTSWSNSTTFCRENASTTSKRQKMLSKNLLNTEVWNFMLQG